MRHVHLFSYKSLFPLPFASRRKSLRDCYFYFYNPAPMLHCKDIQWTQKAWYLELFIIPSTWTKALVPAEEKEPQITMLPPPCFTMGLVFFGDVLCCF